MGEGKTMAAVKSFLEAVNETAGSQVKGIPLVHVLFSRRPSLEGLATDDVALALFANEGKQVGFQGTRTHVGDIALPWDLDSHQGLRKFATDQRPLLHPVSEVVGLEALESSLFVAIDLHAPHLDQLHWYGAVVTLIDSCDASGLVASYHSLLTGERMAFRQEPTCLYAV